MSAPYSITTAKNGLTILTVPRAGTEAAMVSVLYRAGSRYESPATNGLAHFNEHMVFKGGKKYPTFHEVTQAFDKLGAINNAFTGAEVTGFWAKVRAEHVPQALDVISDTLTAPAYDPAELDKERGVIIEEINMYEDDPASAIYMELEEAMYPNHPMGRSTLGPKENIRKFTVDDFRKYATTHQTPDRAVLVLAGKTDGLDADSLAEYIDRFEGTSDLKPEPFTPEQTVPNLKVRHKQTEQTHLAVALRAPALGSPQTTTFEVLAQLLGGSMSSRLFVEVREKRGLAYYVRAMADQATDTGNLVITAGLTREKSADALTAILNEVKRLRDGDLKPAELEMHKDSLKGRRTLRWEDSMALADFYGEQQLLLGKIDHTTADAIKRIEAVTVEDIVSLVGEIADDSKLNAAVLGPHEHDEYSNKLTLK